MAVMVFVFVAVIVCKIFFLQIVRHSAYYAIAQDQYQSSKKLIPARGKIYVNDYVSKTIRPIAVNETRYLVYAAPNDIKDAIGASAKLSQLLDIPKEDLAKRFGKKNDSYEPIKHGVSRDAVKKIEDLTIAGVKTSEENFRYYPDGVFASHVLGFVGYGDDGKRSGRYGIEGYYDKELEGTAGYIDAELDARGSWIPTILRDLKPSYDGKDFILTLDQAIQFFAEKKIKETVENFKAEEGTIIVMDPKKGSVLAMASYPDFEPNEYWKVDQYEKFLNPAIQKRYELGSVLKPVTMAIAIDSGKVTPTTTYEDKGYVAVGDRILHNFDGEGRGIATMTEVLEQSLNTGAVYAQSLVGKSAFLEYLKDFGFDLPTGIDLYGELGGDLSNLEKNSNSDVAYATASFGQGIAITPLELLTAISAIANDGKLMKPYVVEKIIDSSGEEDVIEPKAVRQVVSPKTAAQLSAMMVSVVKSKYYKKAYLSGYNIAGKTGTAQIPNVDQKGYSDERIHVFVGFGPVPSPQFSILIKVDKPQGEIFASNSISPLFKEMSKFLMDYYHIEPANN